MNKKPRRGDTRCITCRVSPRRGFNVASSAAYDRCAAPLGQEGHKLATRGSVTFISSISALNGVPSGSAYCAGKAAVANLAHTLRLELAGTGRHFGVVHLGFTENDADKRVLDAAGQPVPIAYRSPRWQKSQAEVARLIRRRRRTVVSALGHLIDIVHTCFPRLGDWVVLTSMRRLRRFYE